MFKSFVSWLNKKSIMFRWILSYFVLIVFFMCSTAISIGYFYNTYKQETLRTNEYIMDVAVEEFNGIFSDVSNIIHGVTDDSMRKLIATDLKETPSKEYVYSLIQQYLKRVVGNEESFEQCFLYLEDYDMIISTKSVLDSRLYYSAYFSQNGVEYDDWIKLITRDTHKSFVPANDRFMLVSKNAFPIIYREDSISMVFVLDQSSLNEMNQRIYDTGGAYIVMADLRDNVVNFSGNSKMNDIDISKAHVENDVCYIDVNGEECVLLSEEIPEGNTLILVTPKKVFYNNLLNIMLIQICVLVVIIFITALLAVVFSRMHFSPVKAMLMALNAKETGDNKNEYKVITDIISEFQSEKKSMDIRLSRQEQKLKADFVRGLLRGEEYALASASDSIKHYNINFCHENYMVLIFDITDYDEIWTGYSRKEADFGTIRFALSNIVNEIISQKYPCCTISMHECVACVVNFPQTVEEERIQSELTDIYADVKKHMFEKLGFSFRMVGGGVKTSLEEISTSYAEAMFCLEYNLVYDKKIMFMDNLEEGSSKELNVFFGKTARLVKLIRQGSEHDVEIAAEEWSRMYVSLIAVFPNIMQHEISGLMNSIIRELFSLNYDEDETKEFAEQLMRKYKSDSVLSYAEVKAVLLDVAKDVRGFVEGNGSADYLEKRIVDYIEQNYADQNLNVSKIAEHFKMNATYLSSTFKKSAKIGVLEKINKFRCEKSTELLAKTGNTVNDIAEMVGYSSVHTYIRIFKKYYFQTPTQYRSEMRRGKSET